MRKEVIKCLKASGVEPSESLSELLKAEPEPLSNLKEEQKSLNQRKKFLVRKEKNQEEDETKEGCLESLRKCNE